MVNNELLTFKEALLEVISKCKPGAILYDICVNSDEFIKQKLSTVYNKSKFIKGLAFPTCISVNEVCGNYSAPLEISDNQFEYKALAEGDVAKIDLGVEINGFAAVVAHTVVVSDKSEPVTGKKADVILAAYNSIQAALRTMTKEHNNNEITEIISSVCKDYDVSPVEGVLSHRMKKDIVDGIETIINKATLDQKVDQRVFQHGDVFGLDIIVSTGEGKPKETSIKTTVFKRAVETTYKLKTDSGRKLLSIVEQNFYSFPFTFNSFDKEKSIKLKTKDPLTNLKTTMKLGLQECTKYELLHPYPVIAEKKGDIVAQFKFTVAVRDNGAIIVAGNMIDITKFKSEKKVTNEKVLKILESNLDDYIPNSKKSVKQQKEKKSSKAKRAAKKLAKKKKKEEEERKKTEAKK